ncbi:MAG: HyaD/HybD family hydrogenase maturation endopeptidase [Xanthomonadales bacterium]|nr:HyaD/HybD family hydrogenase maturation endopeptidase [Xanthomonadales bacterium]
MSTEAASFCTNRPAIPAWAHEPAAAPVLVLGMGNVLLEDEGLGVRALEALQEQYLIPAGVDLLDGGTTGMGLLDEITGREHLLVLDAVQTGDPPGTMVRMSGDDVPVYFGLRVTPHQLGLADVLATLQLTGEQPGSVTVLGLVPESLELTLELSRGIRARIGELVQATVEELGNLGCTLKAKA